MIRYADQPHGIAGHWNNVHRMIARAAVVGATARRRTPEGEGTEGSLRRLHGTDSL